MLRKILVGSIVFIYIFFNVSYALTPFDILTWRVFYFDAQDIDWDGDLTNNPTTPFNISQWIDKFGNLNTWFQFSGNQQPILISSGINWYPGIIFDGLDDILNVTDNLLINLDTWYQQKSFVLLFKTSGDVNTFQTIYEQGWKEKWFAFQINWWRFYVWTRNTIDWIDPYKIFDLWSISSNTVYSLILTFDAIWNITNAYLNKQLVWSLTWVEVQTTHWSCIFDTSFWCNAYETWGSIWIWAVKNDTFDIANLTWYTAYEGSFFKGVIWEIIQYNYALTLAEINGLFDYLFVKWWIDLQAPIITGSNVLSWQILPGWNNNIIFYYSDSHTGSLGVDTGSALVWLYKWDSINSSWSSDISSTWLIISSITTWSAEYILNNLDYGKYLIDFKIADNAGNYSDVYSLIFYVDRPTFIISTWYINIWTLSTWSITYSNLVNVQVNTIWAPFRIIIKKSSDLVYSGYIIPDYDGNTWYWISTWTAVLNNFSTWYILVDQVWNLNTNGDINTYNYTFDLGAIISEDQPAWFYTWYVDITVEFSY